MYFLLFNSHQEGIYLENEMVRLDGSANSTQDDKGRRVKSLTTCLIHDVEMSYGEKKANTRPRLDTIALSNLFLVPN